MGRIVKAKIEFTYDEDSIMEFSVSKREFDNGELADPMTEQELIDYATSSFLEDIHNLVKYNEVVDATRVEIIQ